MNRSRKIHAPLTLCASALVTLLALNAPVYATEPDDELEVTMDVVDDANHAATTGAELVVREDHDADDASHESAEHDTAEHDDAKGDDADDDHGGVDNDNDEATEHEEADDGDVNDDGHDGAGEHSSDQPGVSSHD